MGTIADKLNKLLTTKASIKNAIITKGQTVSDDDTFASYADKILAIETGVQLPELSNPASESNVLSGYEFIDEDGTKRTGNIATKTSSDLTRSGATVTVPAGYYASAASKSVSTATQATPSISVSSSGLITVSAIQTAGYVSAGTKSAEHQLSSYDDSDFVASNIKSGVSIFGLEGTYSGSSSSGSSGQKTVYLSESDGDFYVEYGDTYMVTLPESASTIHNLGVVSTGDSGEIVIFMVTNSVTTYRRFNFVDIDYYADSVDISVNGASLIITLPETISDYDNGWAQMSVTYS